MKHAHTVPVLMYHHVSPTPGYISVSSAHFGQQLQWLSRHGYRSLTADEFAGHLHGEPVSPRSVLITFDDGYLDNWVHAYPLLKQYGYHAVIFLVTGWPGVGPVRPHSGQAGQPDTPDHAQCERLIAQREADAAVLRWSEIEAMRASGVFEFHSHTHTHTRWDQSDPAHKNVHMAQELAQSRQTLHERLGQMSGHLCWPQGYFDADYVRIAQEAGFNCLYTTHAFGQNRAGSDPAHIYRFAVRDTSGESVGRRIGIAAHPLAAPLFNRYKLWKRSLRKRA